jgi:hypothetical protein
MTLPKSSPPAQPEPAASSSPTPSDVALVHRITPDGALHVIRRRGDRLEAGALAPLREGAPISGEVVSLRPRPDCPVLCDVDVLYTPPAKASAETPASHAPSRKGPAQVATDTYRDNWESIWSGKKTSAVN